MQAIYLLYIHVHVPKIIEKNQVDSLLTLEVLQLDTPLSLITSYVYCVCVCMQYKTFPIMKANRNSGGRREPDTAANFQLT